MQLLDELRAAGVRATGYDQLGVEGIDADLPKPVPPRVRDVLTRHRRPYEHPYYWAGFVVSSSELPIEETLARR